METKLQEVEKFVQDAEKEHSWQITKIETPVENVD
jgi:hypothetical protein